MSKGKAETSDVGTAAELRINELQRLATAKRRTEDRRVGNAQNCVDTPRKRQAMIGEGREKISFATEMRGTAKHRRGVAKGSSGTAELRTEPNGTGTESNREGMELPSIEVQRQREAMKSGGWARRRVAATRNGEA